jgi:hypothetical protein
MSHPHVGWTLLLAGLSASCAGGQTGETGTSGSGCACELDPRVFGTLTLDEAEAAGYRVEDALVVTLGPDQRFEGEMMATAPAGLWTARGLEYPVLNPTTKVNLTIAPTGQAQLRRLRPGPECADRTNAGCDAQLAELELGAELTLSEFGSVYSGAGKLEVSTHQPVLSIALSFPGFARDCQPLRDTFGIMQLSCSMVDSPSDGEFLATQRCLEDASWVPLPLETRSQSTWQSRLARPEMAIPLALECAVSNTSTSPPASASLSVTAELAAATCAPFPIRAALDINWSGSTATNVIPAVATITEDPCPSGNYTTADGSLRNLLPNAEQCSLLSIQADVSGTDQNPERFSLALHVFDSGQQLVTVDYRSPSPDADTQTYSQPIQTCHGARIIE